MTTTITNQRNEAGVKNASDCYRQGGKFVQWSAVYPKDPSQPQNEYSIETKEERAEALEYYRKRDSSREYKAIKIDGLYEIFATD